MINNPREKDLSSKQEGINTTSSSDHKPSITNSRLWSGLKNPRIVRVSRASGGKDRHSKVSTVRGLRDRRVRLSVPTAIQLYDLQDRLGLNQPSKVVDWLLNHAQLEIDKLPPLQLPPGGFIQVPAPQGPNRKSNGEGLVPNPFSEANGKGDTMKGNDMLSGFLSNTMPYASYYQWEATNAYLSQLGSRSSQSNEAAFMSINPPSRPPAQESQIVFCPQGIMPSMDFVNMKEFGQLQMASTMSLTPQSNLEINSLHLSSPSTRPFQ